MKTTHVKVEPEPVDEYAAHMEHMIQLCKECVDHLQEAIKGMKYALADIESDIAWLKENL